MYESLSMMDAEVLVMSYIQLEVIIDKWDSTYYIIPKDTTKAVTDIIILRVLISSLV